MCAGMRVRPCTRVRTFPELVRRKLCEAACWCEKSGVRFPGPDTLIINTVAYSREFYGMPA